MRRTRWTTAPAAVGLATLALFGTAACAESEGGGEQGTEQEESESDSGGDEESGEGEGSG
jgi:hypothetical protein